MARSIRIEYEGAYYHVMARGNHRGLIFLDDEDKNYFLTTLGEACEMTGWRVHAWVLMGNHYHLLIETPEANLVEGMKWLQNTYTRRFNVRHTAWGRLFGDRYKAILVEGKSRYYYESMLDYIHLNPMRAGLLNSEKKQDLLDYPWSSLVQGYALPPKERKKWMVCIEGLKSFNFPDTTTGRRHMVERLNRRALVEKADQCGLPIIKNDLEAQDGPFSQGWHWGTQEFAEKMLLLRDSLFGKQKSRAYHAAPEHKAHGLQQAKAWLQEGLLMSKLTEQELVSLKGSDPRKVFLALFLRKKTTVANSWLADQLKMKSAANVSQQLARTNLKELSHLLPPSLVEFAISEGFEW